MEKITKYRMKDVGMKKWFENYWFHYKLHTIVSIFLVVILIIFIRDMLSREKYDTTIIIASQSYISDQAASLLENEIESKFAKDYDGDGKVNITLDVINFPKDFEKEDPQILMAATTRFMGSLQIADSIIMLVDDFMLDEYLAEEEGMFVEGKKVALKDINITDEELKKGIPDLYFVQRNIQTNNEKKLKWFDYQRELYDAIVSK